MMLFFGLEAQTFYRRRGATWSDVSWREAWCDRRWLRRRYRTYGNMRCYEELWRDATWGVDRWRLSQLLLLVGVVCNNRTCLWRHSDFSLFTLKLETADFWFILIFGVKTACFTWTRGQTREGKMTFQLRGPFHAYLVYNNRTYSTNYRKLLSEPERENRVSMAGWIACSLPSSLLSCHPTWTIIWRIRTSLEYWAWSWCCW